MMVKRQTAAQKRRHKKQRRKSRWPSILVLLSMIGVPILLIMQSNQSGPNVQSGPIGSVATTLVDSDATTSETPQTTQTPETSDAPPATDSSNLGQPVKVHSDTLGDLDVDQVINDWTQMAPPDVPTQTIEIQSTWIEGNFITANLPDGMYWGYPVNTFDEDERGVNFELRSSLDEPTTGQQLYPSYLQDLLFVSLAIQDSSVTKTNIAMTQNTFWSLIDGGLPTTVTIPLQDFSNQEVGLVSTPFLVTIVGGAIIAVEGVIRP